MSKIRNNVRHPRFVTEDNTTSVNDSLNDLEKIIKKKDSVELEELFEYAESYDLLEKVTKRFHFGILYDLLDTQDFQLIKIALDRVGYNIITDDDETPLTWAAFEGKLGCVKFLIENGADVNLETPDENFALYSAIQNLETDTPNIKVFEYLYPLTSEDLQRDILEFLRDSPMGEELRGFDRLW